MNATLCAVQGFEAEVKQSMGGLYSITGPRCGYWLMNFRQEASHNICIINFLHNMWILQKIEVTEGLRNHYQLIHGTVKSRQTNQNKAW